MTNLYSPYINHFIQPDTIIPNPSDPQSWNRYSYVQNNPIRYTDPTGHVLEIPQETSNGCDSECRRQLIFKQHNHLKDYVAEGGISDLEALARLTEYGALISRNCNRCFVNDLGAVLTGHDGDDGRTAAYRELEIQAGLPGVEYNALYEKISGTNELMQSGYSKIFQDPAYETEGIGGNQAHHYWFFVQVGYESGFYSGVIGSLGHETIAAKSTAGMSYQDYALGVEGAQLGTAIRWGVINPRGVGNYIRQTLSPGSYSAMYWAYPVLPIFP